MLENWKLSWTESITKVKLLTAGKPCTRVVDLKHGSYKVVLMLPPLCEIRHELLKLSFAPDSREQKRASH